MILLAGWQLLGPESFPACGGLWQPVAGCGNLWRPEAAHGNPMHPMATRCDPWQTDATCGNLWQPVAAGVRAPILEYYQQVG